MCFRTACFPYRLTLQGAWLSGSGVRKQHGVRRQPKDELSSSTEPHTGTSESRTSCRSKRSRYPELSW
jgi:hypothetical protein